MGKLMFALDYNSLPNFKLRPCTRAVLSLQDELDIAIRYNVSLAAKRPIFLTLNNSRSAVIATLLTNLKIPFTVMLHQYYNGMTNEDEISSVVDWCDKNKFSYYIAKLDLTKYVLEDVAKWYDKNIFCYDIVKYPLLHYLSDVERLGGYLLGGEYELLLGKLNEGADWSFLSMPDSIYSPLKWCQQYKTIQNLYFFSTTPELIAAFLMHPMVQEFRKQPFNPDVPLYKPYVKVTDELYTAMSLMEMNLTIIPSSIDAELFDLCKERFDNPFSKTHTSINCTINELLLDLGIKNE